MTLNECFDKIYYLNLAKDTDRNENIQKEFAKFDITNYERIEGEIITEIPDQSLWRNLNKDKISDKYILGSLGCRATHIKAIKKAKEDGHKKVLILEDDVKFLANPNNILQRNPILLSKNWDMLYFGGLIEHHFRSQIVGAYAYGIAESLYDEVIYMAEASGMEIDNFYAKIVYHMSYNYNHSGRYDVKTLHPFGTIVVDSFKSNIQPN